MEAVLNKPEMTVLKTGKSFKTFQIDALEGMEMPNHHCTKETVVVVNKGKAILDMPYMKYVLDKGTTFIIPAGVNHTLSIQKDFKAVAITAANSEIEFV